MPGEIFIEVIGSDLSGLENEAGGHRVQRVPPTERKGRVHTSTITVAITDTLVQEKEYKDEDFRIEWYSGTGSGGQHRNKKQNSCRVTYIPTSQVITAQSRSRVNNLEEAKTSLIQMLKNGDNATQKLEIDSIRKNQVGSGMRGDKIRTYRFQDDTVTDHITGKSANLKKVMRGNFDLLW